MKRYIRSNTASSIPEDLIEEFDSEWDWCVDKLKEEFSLYDRNYTFDDIKEEFLYGIRDQIHDLDFSDWPLAFRVHPDFSNYADMYVAQKEREMS